MVCVCVCLSAHPCICVPKSEETIRRELDLFNEPRGDAEFMCFHLQLGEAWHTNSGEEEGLVIYDFVEAGTLAATGHPDPLVHFFRKKWILSMGETQASDLLLGALIKGLS